MSNQEPSTIIGNEDRPAFRDWLREDEVMRLLGCSRRALREWRLRRCGPAFIVWNSKYVIYNPRSVAYFQRARSPHAPWRAGHPLLPVTINKQ